jgi:hypothetical protein
MHSVSLAPVQLDLASRDSLRNEAAQRMQPIGIEWRLMGALSDGASHCSVGVSL